MAEAGGASGEKGVWNGVSARMGAGVDGAGVQGLARRGTRLGVASMATCAQIFPGGLACGLGLRGWLDWFAATGASALRGAVGASKPRSWLREANMLVRSRWREPTWWCRRPQTIQTCWAGVEKRTGTLSRHSKKTHSSGKQSRVPPKSA